MIKQQPIGHWYNQHSAQRAQPVYALLNSLSEAKPVEQWKQQGWLMQERPLFYLTPLEPILTSSPWLAEVDPLQLAAIERWVSQQGDTSWGWLYLPVSDWQSQLTHWQNYLQVMLRGQLRAIRFYDPRVLAIWLAHDPAPLWPALLSALSALWINGDAYTSPLPQQAPVALPWQMPDSYLTAWYQSDFGLKVQATTLEIELWEQHPPLAGQLYAQQGAVDKLLFQWLDNQRQQGVMIESITLADYLMTIKE